MDLHIQYRPKDFEEVFGQSKTTNAIAAMSAADVPKAMLFVGPAGTGKTTLARLVAKKLGLEEDEAIEIDAASHNGVEKMRDLVTVLSYPSLSGKPKCLIIDECHVLSRQAWDVLLKPLEDDSSDVRFCFCTTEANKIPATIASRCVSFVLTELTDREMADLLDFVLNDLSQDVEEETIDLIIDAARGSPRRALVALSQILSSGSFDTIKIGVSSAEQNLLRLLNTAAINGKSFNKGLGYLALLKQEGRQPESLRIMILNYGSSVVLNKQSNDDRRERWLHIFEAFRDPYRDYEGYAPIILSLAEAFSQ